MIPQAVAKHLSTADSAEPPVESEASKQRRMSTLLWGIAAFIIGMALIVVDKQFLHHDWIGLIGVLVLLLGAFVAIYRTLASLRRITSPSRNPPRMAELPQAGPTAPASAEPSLRDNR